MDTESPGIDEHGDARPEPGLLAYHPALDGLRGLAVAAVLAFHSNAAWARGGYLGVSAFFTLSGFLIASLIVAEHRGGSIDLPSFWARRVRRLLPVALAGVIAAAVYTAAAADAATLDRFGGDALAAVAGVANWRFVVSELSYADLFGADSPLQHYWSLAIEQQFYVVFPIVAAVALRRRSGDDEGSALARLRAVVFVGIVVSVSASVVVGTDRAYYGTDTRMAELLVGVLLALSDQRRSLTSRFSARVRLGLGAPALAAVVVAWSTVGQTTAALHPWILLGHALLTAVVIAAAIGDSPLSRLLARPGLTGLGRISYGVYVFHWPIFLWLSSARTGLDGLPLAVLRIAATLAVTIPVHRLLEDPARRRRDVIGGRLVRIAALAVVVTATAALLPAVLIDRRPAVDFAAAEALQDALNERPGPTTDTTAATTTEPADGAPPEAPVVPDRPVVSVFGDSTALFLLPGLDAWATSSQDIVLSASSTTKGCGVTRDGVYEFPAGVTPPPAPDCAFDELWPPVLARADPDIALVSIGLWDLIDLRVPGDDRSRSIGDPVFDAYLRAEMTAATDLLLATAERVVWVIQPPPVAGTRDGNDPVLTRLPLLNATIIDLFEDDPRVGLVDVPAWLESTSDGIDSLRLRPDGTHFSEETSAEAADWLGPALLEAAVTGGRIGPTVPGR